MTSRREFLASTAALAGAAATQGFAQQPKARYRRYNQSSANGARMLDSYEKAVRAMLKLPPSDPRNWYRNALVHTLDCPHGNWWFLIWHRGYVGWFEQVCRDLSGDKDFAFPYWDWTQVPRIPARMFQGALNPNDPAFIASFAEFKKAFGPTLDGMWKAFNRDQVNQLLVRGLRFPLDLWFDIDTTPMFFDRGKARDLTKEKPDLPPQYAVTVIKARILDCLAPRDFTTFGSTKARFHSTLIGFGPLEAFPHNQVHNGTGGFMQDNLSPVDPIFMLHHANIDRLWDVWTRKQQGFGYPIAPEGKDLDLWNNEPFLFFRDAKGNPVTKTKAGDYFAIGDFAYDYEPGTGEEVVPKAPQASRGAASSKVFSADAPEHANAIALPADVVAKAAAPESRLFAKITVDFPPLGHEDVRFVMDGPEDAEKVGDASPQNLGTFSMFGHHVMHCPVTITVPISTPVAALRASGALRENQPMSIRVVPVPKPPKPGVLMRHEPGEAPEVKAIVVESQ